MIEWNIHHAAETVSTNVDARDGIHGDVFTADFQTSGKGRHNHKWLSERGQNLIMSAVLDVCGKSAQAVSTLPLVIGLSVLKALERFIGGDVLKLKWPNDVLVDGKKICGILCERHDDLVIAGIGVNVSQRVFPSELSSSATSLTNEGIAVNREDVLQAVLVELTNAYDAWSNCGFESIYPEVANVDFLRGRHVSVRQTDDDSAPIVGICGGIRSDGALDVGCQVVYAGEAHLEEVR